MKTDREAWRARLKAARHATGKSQREVASEIQRPQSTYGAWEAGQNEPDLETFQQIAAALNVPVAWLVFGVGDDPPGIVIASSDEECIPADGAGEPVPNTM